MIDRRSYWTQLAAGLTVMALPWLGSLAVPWLRQSAWVPWWLLLSGATLGTAGWIFLFLRYKRARAPVAPTISDELAALPRLTERQLKVMTIFAAADRKGMPLDLVRKHTDTGHLRMEAILNELEELDLVRVIPNVLGDRHTMVYLTPLGSQMVVSIFQDP